MKYIFFILTLSLSLITAAEPKRKALIFGITGQDGAYLTKLLLDKDYEVYGVKRRAANTNTQKLEAIFENTKYSLNDVILHYGDLSDACSIFEIVKNVDLTIILSFNALKVCNHFLKSDEFTLLGIFDFLIQRVS